jgi:uncharacterized membrane protein
MKTPVSAILCVLTASALGAAGQFLYKSGTDRVSGGFWDYLANPRLLGGMLCYLAVMILFIVAFKKGGEVSVLYPVYASTFIFAAVGAWVWLGEELTMTNVAGMGLMVGGMLLMGWRAS